MAFADTDRLTEIDEMISHEKLQAALEQQQEVWAEGLADGIEADILADAATVVAMLEVVRLRGESGAETLIETLRKRLAAGDFSPERTLQ